MPLTKKIKGLAGNNVILAQEYAFHENWVYLI